jgi:hypothetical protein
MPDGDHSISDEERYSLCNPEREREREKERETETERQRKRMNERRSAFKLRRIHTINIRSTASS